MPAPKEIRQWIQTTYPELDQTIYVKTVADELKKFLKIDQEIPSKVLITYLTSICYTSIEDDYMPKIPDSNVLEEDNEDDFDLAQFLSSEEFEKEKAIISDYKSYQDNNLLLEKMEEATDSEYREEIINQFIVNNQLLVKKVVRRYLGTSGTLTKDDLISEGNIGLLRAIEKFDKERGIEFSTYAVPWIRQRILRAIADQSTIVRVPVHRFEQIRKVGNVKRRLTVENPNYILEDVLRECNITEQQYYDLQKDESLYLHMLSLNSPLKEYDTGAGEIIDLIGFDQFSVLSPDSLRITQVEQYVLERLLQQLLIKMLDTLTDRESEVIKMRFGLNTGRTYTLEEVGLKMGVTRERIRQIEAKALGKLRHPSRSKLVKSYIENID
ncbi:sigma-70 family RNA polymerase sigma factor [Peribacillus frigoritolerans]|uniref:sigma-70 family RNA polymerase sigma factor n=1 Tax=Peribacillus frigoritolerans TaxID=450367 RepID=UPI003CFF38EB